MDDQTWRDGYALLDATELHFELQTPYWHLDAASDLAADFPQTTIALNHCGLPADRSEEGLLAWRRALEMLARNENVRIKLSGLGVSPGVWPQAQNIEIIQTAIGIFGPRRAMFASNFPVDGLCVDMNTMFTTYKIGVADMTEADIRALFCDNSAALYRLRA
ncbi:amidohydrolase family protein [Devosia algicola]|uniref:Amidohydrolase family protein n=2 Tax=Devosia algicola TaxID=3026418 RepID=A0ABY7YQM4_9HYPH|nr:amidohydrolase family protein [Devosia algicola]WDR03487.1 amidohydrolase family protein [Devosia algicola]